MMDDPFAQGLFYMLAWSYAMGSLSVLLKEMCENSADWDGKSCAKEMERILTAAEDFARNVRSKDDER